MVDISLLEGKVKDLITRINKYLESDPDFKAIPFTDQQNINRLGQAYTNAQYMYEDLQRLITQSEYLQSILKQIMSLLSPSVMIERDMYNKAKALLDSLYNSTAPLYNVRTRVEHLIWLYRSSYSIYR